MELGLHNVSKSFGENKVIEDLSLEFPKRGITVIMAPSGSGKTTLLRLIAGLERPDNGKIIFHGDRLGVVFQESRLFPWLTAVRNITEFAGVDRKQAEDLLIKFRMGTDLDTYPEALSGGMQRRVALARALAYGGMLLLDEPFNGLDIELLKDVIKIIKDYSKENSVVVITHSSEEAKLLDGKILHFESFVQSGSPV